MAQPTGLTRHVPHMSTAIQICCLALIIHTAITAKRTIDKMACDIFGVHCEQNNEFDKTMEDTMDGFDELLGSMKDLKEMPKSFRETSTVLATNLGVVGELGASKKGDWAVFAEQGWELAKMLSQAESKSLKLLTKGKTTMYNTHSALLSLATALETGDTETIAEDITAIRTNLVQLVAEYEETIDIVAKAEQQTQKLADQSFSLQTKYAKLAQELKDTKWFGTDTARVSTMATSVAALGLAMMAAPIAAVPVTSALSFAFAAKTFPEWTKQERKQVLREAKRYSAATMLLTQTFRNVKDFGHKLHILQGQIETIENQAKQLQQRATDGSDTNRLARKIEQTANHVHNTAKAHSRILQDHFDRDLAHLLPQDSSQQLQAQQNAEHSATEEILQQSDS